MSALDRFPQSRVSSSYCESKVVSMLAVAGLGLSEDWSDRCMVLVVASDEDE